MGEFDKPFRIDRTDTTDQRQDLEGRLSELSQVRLGQLAQRAVLPDLECSEKGFRFQNQSVSLHGPGEIISNFCLSSGIGRPR